MSSTLFGYAKECSDIYNELTILIDDIEFASSGGRVDYACDFSEIYSYVFPESRSNWMRLFPDDDRTTIFALDHAAIGTLFCDLSPMLALLPPYAMELASFADDIIRNAAISVSLDRQSAMDEIRALIQSEDFRLLRQLLERADQHHSDDSDRERMKELLERYAGRLVALARSTQRLRPAIRLGRLLGDNRFPRSDDYRLKDEDLNDATVERWFTELVRRRDPTASRAACYLDARAVATIEAGWLAAKQPRPRAHLVTRSRHMNALYAEEQRKGMWQHVPFSIVIHPRVFALVNEQFPPAGPHAATVVESLRTFAGELGRFVHAYQNADEKDAATAMTDALRRAGLVNEKADDRVQLLQRITEPWRAAASLKSTRYGGFAGDSDTTEDRGLVVRMLRTIRENREMHALVNEVVDELLLRIQEQHEILSRHIADLQAGVDGELYKKSKAVLRSAVYWMPVTLQFSSQEVRSWLERASTARDVAHLVQVGDHDTNCLVRYERLLATAYLLGTWRKWDFARTACDGAVSVALGCEDIAPHEAHFLRGVCCRHIANAPGDYVAALTELDVAGDIKKKLRGSEYEDPRYLKEKATVIFEWNARAQRDSAFDVDIPDVEEAVRLSRKAISLTTDDDRLLGDLHNNLCFYYLLFQPTGWKNAARTHYEKLHKVLSKGTVTASPAQIDTLVRAEFCLRLSDDYRALLARLDAVLLDESVAYSNRKSVERLYKQIEKRLATITSGRPSLSS